MSRTSRLCSSARRLELLLPLIIWLPVGAANGRVLHVPEEYTTIGEAIAVVESGDTVLVAPGEYRERLIFPGTDFNLCSYYSTTQDSSYIGWTVINAEDFAHSDTAAVLTFVHGNSLATSVCGFLLTGGNGVRPVENGGQIGGAIYVENSHPVIEHCRITGNRADHQCVLYASGSHMILRHCRIYGNCSTIQLLATFRDNYTDTIAALVEWNTVGRNTTCDGRDYLWADGFNAVFTRLNVRYNHFVGCRSRINMAGGFYSSRGEWAGNLVEDLESGGDGTLLIWTDEYDVHFHDNIIRNVSLGPYGAGINLGHGRNPNPFVSIVERNWFENVTNTVTGACGIFSSNPHGEIRYNAFVGCQGSPTIIQTSHVGPLGCRMNIHHNLFLSNNTDSEGRFCISTIGAGPVCPVYENWFEGNRGQIALLDSFENESWGLRNNYWGHSSGPYHLTENPAGQGDTADTDIIVTPWLTEPPDLESAIREKIALLPEDWSLLQAYPNPFNASLHIIISSSKWQPLELTAYNILGQSVARIWRGIVTENAPADVRWDGLDDQRRSLASGVYYIVAHPQGNGGAAPKSLKVVLLR